MVGVQSNSATRLVGKSFVTDLIEQLNVRVVNSRWISVVYCQKVRMSFALCFFCQELSAEVAFAKEMVDGKKEERVAVAKHGRTHQWRGTIDYLIRQ